MAYKPIHAWKRKDKLPSKDPQKIIYGSQLQDEFDAIADNLDLLAQIDIDGDGNINIPPGLIDGLAELLGDKADKADLEAEIAARIAGDQALQKQIDELDTGGGGGASSWDELTGKPTEFPPEAHSHEIDDVTGLQDALDAAGGAPAWDDVTGKPTEFPPEAHTHEQSEIDGLEDRLTSIEGSISDGGGFIDAPNDGKLYGRQSEAWAEVVIPEAVNPDWDDIQNKPTEYPPASHDHDGVYQPVGDYIEGDAPNDGEEYARKNQSWVKLQDHNYTGADAVKITGDQTVAGHKTWTDVATFGDTLIARGSVNGDTTANFQNEVTAGSFVKSGGTSSQYLMADGSVSDGAGDVDTNIPILDSPPGNPELGQQFFSSTDGYLYIWYGAEWVAVGGTA